MRQETKLWLERADYDLETAEAMLNSARYLYVAFACQQEFLILLTQYYLNTRYVDFKQKLSQEMSREKAQSCLQKTREIIECLKKEFKT